VVGIAVPGAVAEEHRGERGTGNELELGPCLDRRGCMRGLGEAALDHPRVAVEAVVAGRCEDLHRVGAAGGAQRAAEQVGVAGGLVVEVGEVCDAA
jgi:hypothetical protein